MYDVDYLNALIEGLTELKKFGYCRNRKVATGEYDCNYAEVVNNTIVCKQSCMYSSKYCSINFEFESSLNDEDIVDYPFWKEYHVHRTV